MTSRASGGSVIVGLDFGTTFSGFAYTHEDDPGKIYLFQEWPEQGSGGGLVYCKTQTSLYYAPNDQGKLQLRSYGWPASVEYHKALSSAAKSPAAGSDPATSVGYLVTKFKLNLAPMKEGCRNGTDCANYIQIRDTIPLPPGLTTEIVITDYLREISKSIMLELKNRYSDRLTMRDVQWCLTVPALWDDHAKQLMKSYAEQAGMVVPRSNPCSSDASPHPLEIVLEPEAAALYCLSKNLRHVPIEEHEMFLTADIGGGTVDIVVHKKLNKTATNTKLQEVTRSMGGVGGGTYVDDAFMDHMCRRISCLKDFLKSNPLMQLSMLGWWAEAKRTFDGTTSATFGVPAKLYKAWEEYDHANAPALDINAPVLDKNRDEVEFTPSELRSIFDLQVDQIISFIAEALVKKEMQSRRDPVRVIMVVGGFASSPYLMKRLRERFTVPGITEVVSPPDPGSAVCQGAAMITTQLGHAIVSRVLKKTYGVGATRTFRKGKGGDRPSYKVINDEGDALCDNVFHAFVRNGDSVAVDQCVTQKFQVWSKSMREMDISLYSTNQRMVKYITDKSVKEEHTFTLDISAGMDVEGREIEVRIYFGGTVIRMEVQGVNFQAEGAAELEVDSSAFKRKEEKHGPIKHKVCRKRTNPVYTMVDNKQSDCGMLTRKKKPVFKCIDSFCC